MKRFVIIAICALIILLPLCSCSQTGKPSTASFEAMDTVMTLSVYGDNTVCDRLEERVGQLDRLLDATDENSEIYQLNYTKTGSVSDDTAALLRRSLTLSKETDGAFDPTVYPAVLAWGFMTSNYLVPDEAERKILAESIDYTAVQLDENGSVTLPDDVMLDLGAVAKGYAADVCKKLLSSSKAQAAILNLGGTICLYGEKPDGSRFKVGVADPDNPAGYFGYLSCDGGVIATSGGYERYFDAEDGTRYIHILDPSTAAPVNNGTLSVTILSDSGADADALSTALFVMGAEKAAAYYRSHDGFEYILLTDDGRLYLSEGIADDFSLGDGYDFTVETIGR